MEYAKANCQDDEMCLSVQSVRPEARAEVQLAESISVKSKGIDGTYSFGFGYPKPKQMRTQHLASSNV
jgi:hypothetical protein